MIKLSRHVEPRYRELANVLRHELQEYAAGDYLPSEKQLASRFEVNRHTLRRALDVLVAEGRIVRRQGRGSCVLPPPIVYPLHARSAYSNVVAEMGHKSDAVLLGRRRRRASADEVRHLALESDASVIEVLTLRMLNGQPASLIAHSFAQHNEPLLATYRGGSVREYLQQQDISLTRVFSVIGAGLPSQQEAVQLLMPQQSAVLKVRTLSCDSNGVPFELACTVSRADRFQFLVVSEGEFTDDF